ncbi:MAG: recombinase family protein [Sulfuritalea sp.]|nr:recombinase family protein [Sulfuritalea sp.]
MPELNKPYISVEESEAGTVLLRAAQYVRMSTEHQQYSTRNQSDKIGEYAGQRGISIVRTYADEGKSGLSISGRAALQRLIADVESGKTDFSVILVYDVSRWGRFQDADESAYYEYICKRAGIRVAYVAEQFENDGSPVSTIVKGVKRAMAGEYSRELSTKVFAGQCRMIENGFRQGGSAGFGLRRVLIDQAGNIKGTLNPGEQKNIQTDRVILLPGPADEVRMVNSIFRWLIDEDLSISQMIARLNKMDVRTDLGRRWTFSTVREVLTNEKYIGNNIYNRRSFKLKKLQVKNPPAMWIRKEAAFEGIVPPEIFWAAQQVLNARATKYTDEELLERLRLVYQKRGRLSSFIIDQSPDLPGYDAVTRRFGSLARAYDLIGFRPKADLHYFEVNRKLRQRYPEIIARTQQTIAELGGDLWRDPATDLLHLNRELVISLVLVRCRIMPSGMKRWRVRFDPAKFAADITLAIRLDPTNEAELDYFLLPRLNFQFGRIHLKEKNLPEYECFRFTSLDFFYGLARRIDVQAGLRARRSMNGDASIAA